MYIRKVRVITPAPCLILVLPLHHGLIRQTAEKVFDLWTHDEWTVPAILPSLARILPAWIRAILDICFVSSLDYSQQCPAPQRLRGGATPQANSGTVRPTRIPLLTSKLDCPAMLWIISAPLNTQRNCSPTARAFEPRKTLIRAILSINQACSPSFPMVSPLEALYIEIIRTIDPKLRGNRSTRSYFRAKIPLKYSRQNGAWIVMIISLILQTNAFVLKNRSDQMWKICFAVTQITAVI